MTIDPINVRHEGARPAGRQLRAGLAGLACLLALAPTLAAAGAPAQPSGDPAGDIVSGFIPNHRSFEYEKRVVIIPMRDGVRLNTVIVIPKGAANAPILLDRTPYSAMRFTSSNGGGPSLDDILSKAFAELARKGYIIVAQDVRGKYGSEGEYVMNRPLRGPLNPTATDHSTDAYDTIDWLVKNVPESNGRVGTIGTSYDGFTALMSLVGPHPALKASVPINPMVDVWKGDDWFHNGAFRQEMMSYLYGQTATKNSDEPWFTTVYDDYASFLGYGSPSAYARAMGMDQLPAWRRLIQHPAYDDYWKRQALDRILAGSGTKVPTLLVGSLWDQEDIYGAPAVFGALRGHGDVHLLVGPWSHGQVNRDGFELGPLAFGEDTSRWARDHVIYPFLDAYLKDGSPPAAIAPVTAYQTGSNRWQRLADWPGSCASSCASGLTPLHLAAGYKLEFAPASTFGSNSYVSDPARPVTYRQRPNLAPWAAGSTWRNWLVDDQRFAEARPDVLTYATQPLANAVEVRGAPLVHLLASTSGSDSDWIVKLIDVYPDRVPARPELGGYELPVAMDIFRARYWKDAARPAPLPPNRPVAFEWALPGVNHVFLPGHRIMVQIQSSWFPLYDRNPQTFVQNIFDARPGDYRSATQRIFFGPRASFVGLPLTSSGDRG